MSYASDSAETLTVAGNLTTYAYRDLGEQTSAPPLVLLQRFRGTMDHWDPAFLEPLISERRVLLFDSIGVSQTPGVVPTSVRGMAEAAVDFIRALGLDHVDLLGWSLGGFVAQIIALEEPDLVRRAVVAGSGPGAVPGSPELDPHIVQLMMAEVSSDEDFLYLFFGPDDASQAVGRQSLARLEPRLKVSEAEVVPQAWNNQLQAILDWASGHDSAWSRLPDLEIPVLVASGAHDVMLDSGNSFAMAKRLKHATAVFYSDSGHAFLFQHPDEFARVVLDFLAANRGR